MRVSKGGRCCAFSSTGRLVPSNDQTLDQALVGVDDCERVSRDVSAALDVADNIAHTYLLEVSSPGLDRPLRRERDFARFVGESARVRLEAGVEGRRNFSGTIRGAKDGHVEIACDGRSYELPIDDIVRANLIPDWDREFARAGEAGPGRLFEAFFEGPHIQ